MKKIIPFLRNAVKNLAITILLMQGQTVFGQSSESMINNLNLSFTSDPLLIIKHSQPNLQAVISWKCIALSVNASYLAANTTEFGFTNQHQASSMTTSVRLYPFTSLFNCLHRSLVKKTPRTSCYSFEQPADYYNRPNGPYISAGYHFEKLSYTFSPDSSNHVANGTHQFGVKNNGIQLEAGYQLTTRRLSFGIGYHLLMSVPIVEGSVNPFGNALYTNTYPFKYRIQQGLSLQIGFNLSM